MKILLFVSLLVLCASCGHKKEGYILRSDVPDLQDGMVVSLRNAESDKRELLARDTVRDGRFELRGKVESPLLCELTVSNKPLVKEKKKIRSQKAWVFLDNSCLTLTAPCFDSIGYVSLKMSFDSERVGAVAGSPLQKQFNAYRRVLLPLELAADTPRQQLSHMSFYDFEYEPEEYARLYAEQYALLAAARAEVQTARMRFVQEHPRSPVSLFVADAIVKDAGDFGLTSEELDNIEEGVRGVTSDTARSARFRRHIKRARQLARGIRFGNFTLENLKGDSVALEACVPAGRYTLVDFWASWCAPCRAALPQVKEMFRRYDGRLAVVSVSVDKKADDWKRAVREEKLTEWPQLRVDTNRSLRDLYRYYNITAIPSLLLIDLSGHVLFITNDSQELGLKLEEVMN